MKYEYKHKTAEERKEEMNNLLQKLKGGVNDYANSDEHKKLLDVYSKFHDYSFNNSMLIYAQKPDATRVASFTSWKENFNRSVNAGEHGIKIICPNTSKKHHSDDVEADMVTADTVDEETEERYITGYRIGHVFDISQTSQIDGKPVINLDAVKELNSDVENYTNLITAVKTISPVPVEAEDIKGEAKGYFDSSKERIAYREGMSESQTFKTLAHEVAHSYLHSREKLEKRKEEGLEPFTHEDKEVQAESVAYVVSNHYGIDTSSYSFPYITSWKGDAERITKNLKEIKETSSMMIGKMDKELERLYAQQSELQHRNDAMDLTIKLDRFNREFDPYEYGDNEGYEGQIFNETFSDVLNHNTDSIKKYLEEINYESRDEESRNQALSLMTDIEEYDNKYSFKQEESSKIVLQNNSRMKL